MRLGDAASPGRRRHILYRRVTLDLGLFDVRMTNIDQLLLRALMPDDDCRDRLAGLPRPASRSSCAHEASSCWRCSCADVAVAGLSPQTLGRPLDLTGSIRLLYDYVPGFDGLRVPARFAMVVGPDARRPRRIRRGGIVAMALGHADVRRADDRIPRREHRAPVPVNGMGTLRDYATPEPRVYRPARAPAVYQRLARESGVVLAELPLGQPDYDIRAMFYSIVHHAQAAERLQRVLPAALRTAGRWRCPTCQRHATIAWDALRDAGATHVIVHEAAWLDDRGPRTTAASRSSAPSRSSATARMSCCACRDRESP